MYEKGILDCKIEMVIGSKEGIYAFERAKKHGYRYFVVSKKRIWGRNTIR